MKKIIWCMAIILSGGSLVQAQTAKEYKVKDGEAAADAISALHLYRYPAFQQGQVVYTNGKFSSATFNYNLLLGEVQFINAQGDTLTLGREPALISVSVGESTFLYNPEEGYAEVVADYNTLRLGRRQKLESAGTEKVGAYNQSTRASAIESKSSYLTSSGRRFNLSSGGSEVFSEKVSFYLIDESNRFHRATKSSVSRLFPNHKKEIYGYVKEHSLNLSREEDLKQLLQFCSALGA
ncbi:hypothetical protein DXT99_20330 [Pontibacter diazotrophicus]|uniref:DUF4369 domain-containing protein n=1 Tax=Pontibacter diazotrophicus TaxID=1400979 RepID=A0A3D8L7J0_9BACT|nr:hypothetical protein [Pontibacter diazotrophicus]RDV13368.1 hypothetical protein DXT99_20330 [Pontibacter diazotrophicus]